MKKESQSQFSYEMIVSSSIGALKMMTPWALYKNPVMLVTYFAAIITTISLFFKPITNFDIQIVIWLWVTVFFANFAESFAESRGKAQADALKKMKVETYTHKIVNGQKIKIASSNLKKGDIIICSPGEIIPADAEVIEGVSTVDESAITGESAPVIRESGGDRSAVTSGTTVLSDPLTLQITSDSGNSFLDRMISMIEGAKRRATPNEKALNIVLMTLTTLFILAVVSLKFAAEFSAKISQVDLSHIITIPALAALLVCLIPTTISALLSAVGIAGMNRLVQRNVVAKSGRAVEAAGDIDLLILDKTGTITLGNRMADQFYPAPDIDEKDLAEAAQLASLIDETPEGRSVVVLAKNKFGLRADALDPDFFQFIPFSATTRMSGINFLDKEGKIIREIRKGSKEAMNEYILNQNQEIPKEVLSKVASVAKLGETPLIVTDQGRVLGVISLKDIVKGGIRHRFELLRKMGIKTVMVTGDNALTAAAIAAEAGVDDYIAEATPEMKLDLILKEQRLGKLVAMTGDGTNDAPALAQADIGLVMNTGTQASREAGNMVDLDSNPSKLIDIVEVGKQLLMTRGALTTFSIANDVAKYFAILPALFATLYMGKDLKGPLSVLNIMNLHSSESAILSALIFNALIIIALIPLALKGVGYKSESAQRLLRNNLLIWGLGGLIIPFIGIKALDLIITAFSVGAAA